MKRICSNCKKPILKAHRWRQTHHRFLFWTWVTVAHWDCERPTEIHKHVTPISFEQQLEHDVIYPGLPAEQNLGGDTYPTYGGIKRIPAPNVALQEADDAYRSKLARLD